MRKRSQSGLCIFPGYRWCGPGCSGPGEPVNEVDSCCRNHDECLKAGESRCNCDRQFLKCLKKQMNLNSSEGLVAILIYIFMSIYTCFTCSFGKIAREM